MEKSESSHVKIMNDQIKCTKRMNIKFWDNFLYKRQSEEAFKVQQTSAREQHQGWNNTENYDTSDSGLSDSGSSPEPSTSYIGNKSSLLSGSCTHLSDRPQKLEVVKTSLSDIYSLNEGDVNEPLKRWVSCLAITHPVESFHQLFEKLGAINQQPSVLTYKIQHFCQPYGDQPVRDASLHKHLSQEEPLDYSAKEKITSIFQTKKESCSSREGSSISSKSQFFPDNPKSNKSTGESNPLAVEDFDRIFVTEEELDRLHQEKCLHSCNNNQNFMNLIEEPGTGLTEDQKIALLTQILKHPKQEATGESSQAVMDIVQKSYSKKVMPVSEIIPIVGKEPPSDLFTRALVSTGSRRSRGEKRPIPESQKDDKYFERRRRNNLAAKKSRDNRKKREDLIADRAGFLERENAVLRAQVATMREEAASLRTVLFQRKPEILHLKQRSSVYLDGDTIPPE